MTTLHSPVSEVRLYSPLQVAIATFIGAPIAGGILLSANYRALGSIAPSRWAIASGFFSTAALFFIASLLPHNFPHVLIPGLYTAAARYLTEQFQGADLAAHARGGGALHSIWRAAGIGIACLVAILLVIVAVILFAPPSKGRSAGAVYGTAMVDEPPTTIRCAPPAYPETVRQAGIGGRVMLRLVIDTLGHPEAGSVRAVASPHDSLSSAAVRAMLRCEFTPARVRGRAVRVLVQIPMDFKSHP
jgi:TonB family protein